jgi:hypothetical protein
MVMIHFIFLCPFRSLVHTIHASIPLPHTKQTLSESSFPWLMLCNSKGCLERPSANQNDAKTGSEFKETNNATN